MKQPALAGRPTGDAIPLREEQQVLAVLQRPRRVTALAFQGPSVMEQPVLAVSLSVGGLQAVLYPWGKNSQHRLFFKGQGKSQHWMFLPRLSPGVLGVQLYSLRGDSHHWLYPQ